MKKIIVILFLILSISIIINEKESIIIPKNSIRLRIIANSNTIEDQSTKLSIKKDISTYLYPLLEDTTSIKEARNIISSNISYLEEILDKYNVEYSINYGDNYFPKKIYKGITYPSGTYESLVINLGDAVGKNWWCVLFPPLCLLDENTSFSDKEYRFFLYDLINNIN